ncbi:MAG: hypothetical protein U1F76_17405 [Candidatus Competibacteraceae bacterium]
MLKKGPFSDLSTPALAAKAQAALSNNAYKDAVEAYKQLLKREPRDDWRNALAAAYLGRAGDLAAKAMYKEATILWENIPNLGGQVLQPELYLDWLLRSGQYAKAARTYIQFETQLPAAAIETLEASLAALMLAGQKDLAQMLPATSALRQHLASAQAALHAYCQGTDEAGVREHLKSIPFRSPYKDLRQVLNALIKLESEPAEVLPLLERFTVNSPYGGIAAVIRVCVNRSDGLVQTLANLSPAQQDLAVSLLGLDPRRLRLLRQWSEVRAKPSDKAWFDFIIDQLPLLDREQARRVGLALLPGYPHGLKAYNRLFDPLPPFEAQRLQALRAEREHDYHQAVPCWQNCVNLLRQNRHQADNALAAALILRHMVELRERQAPQRIYGPDLEQTTILNLLEESLRLDPDDKATYLKLAELTKKSGDTKAYYRWVDKALEQFPDDSQVLLAAVETATQRKAFKKAAGFATRLLQLDPINSKARTVLINSHLSHARKLIQAGKYALAEKELDSAGQLEREGSRSGVVEINRGLLASYLKQKDRLQSELQEGLRLAGNPLVAQLRLAVECTRLRLEPGDFRRYLVGDQPQVPSRDDLLALVRAVNTYREEEGTHLDWALEDLQAPLKKAVGRLTTEEDMQVICDCLRQAPHHELLEYFATEALERWKERPLFVYYQILGRARSKLDKVSDRDYSRLEHAFEQAEAAKDTRTATLINQFLTQDLLRLPSAEFGMPPMPEDLFEDLEEIREMLLSVPPKLRDQVLDQILQESSPDRHGIPPEMGKMILKMLLLPDGGGGKPPDFFDDMPLPFDFPSPRQSRRKRKKR